MRLRLVPEADWPATHKREAAPDDTEEARERLNEALEQRARANEANRAKAEAGSDNKR